MRQRVICIMGRVLDQEDGLGVYASNLLRAMLKQDPDSRYVILLRTPKSAQLFAELPNARPQIVYAPSKTVWDQIAVPLVARRVNADIIFNPKFSIPFLTSRPCVFVLQGSDWYVNPQNYRWWDNLYIRTMLPLYCRKATRLLAISQSTVDDLVRYIGIDPCKATVTYASISSHFNTQRDETALAAFKGQYRLPDHFILTVARAYHTGHAQLPPYPGGNNERLLKAYQQYRRAGGKLPLVVAGYKIEEYLRSQGFIDTELEGVQFIGFVPHSEIHRAYQLADLFVLATLCESFGFPIVEAMATGCPAIVPATCASPEVAGKAALLVNPFSIDEIAQAISALASSPQRRDALGVAGLERVKRFTWAETARRTLEVFNEICPPRR
jgi:glycosyltransferase involved in cell wall biosynthesis